MLLCLQENQFPSLSLGLFYGCFPTSHFISGLLCRYSLVCEPCVNKCIFHYDILLYVTVFGREDFRSSLGYSPSVSKAQQYRMSQCFVFLSEDAISVCLSSFVKFSDSLCEERTKNKAKSSHAQDKGSLNLSPFLTHIYHVTRVIWTTFMSKICSMYNHSAS